MSTAIIIAMAIIAAALVASPFLTRKEEWKIAAINQKLEKLKNDKEIFLQAIKDIDFECAEGKLTDKDHQELRDYYKEKAILTIQKIETLESSVSGNTHTTEKEKA